MGYAAPHPGYGYGYYHPTLIIFTPIAAAGGAAAFASAADWIVGRGRKEGN
jgi:hypothetical protein